MGKKNKKKKNLDVQKRKAEKQERRSKREEKKQSNLDVYEPDVYDSEDYDPENDESENFADILQQPYTKEIMNQIVEEGPVEAIKWYRQQTGAPLEEAKNKVDSILDIMQNAKSHRDDEYYDDEDDYGDDHEHGCECGCHDEDFFEDDDFQELVEKQFAKLEELEEKPTEEIFGKLRDLGVDIDEEKFVEEAKKSHSLEKITEHWCEKYGLEDDEFLWPAIQVLWDRLASEVFCFDIIEAMISRGALLIEEGKKGDACEIWLEVWGKLKDFCENKFQNVDDLDNEFIGLCTIRDWCLDLEKTMEEAGFEDMSFYEKRIQFSKEWCALFPKSNESLVVHMRCVEAETYFYLGSPKKGEELFEKIVEDHPKNAWSYVGWAEIYRSIQTNYEKVEEIYRMAADKVEIDKEIIEKKLKALESRKHRNEKKKKRAKKKKKKK